MSTHESTSGGDGEQVDAETTAMLERFGTSLRSAAVWEDLPDDLEDRVLAQVDALRTGSGEGATARSRRRRFRPRRVAEGRRRHGPCRRWAPGLAIAAAAIVAFAAGALLTGDEDGRSLEPIADIELRATELGAGASADGTVADAGAGYSINIDVAGLPPAPEGEYYEGWLHDEATGDWVSVGTFHMRSGDGRVVLWSGVPIARCSELVVTSEVEDSAGGRGDILLGGPPRGPLTREFAPRART